MYKEINEEMRQLNEQRIISYVDCFNNDKTELDEDNGNCTYFMKDNIKYIRINNLTFECDNDQFYFIKIIGRVLILFKEDFETEIFEEIFKLNLSNGYISVIPTEDDNTIIFKYNELRVEQRKYKEEDIDKYPLYSLNIQMKILDHQLVCVCSIDIYMSPIDEIPYTLNYYLPIGDKGLDEIIDTALGFYQLSMGVDFGNFFILKKMILNDEEVEICDHHYTQETFLVKDKNDQYMEIPFTHYFGEYTLNNQNNNESLF